MIEFISSVAFATALSLGPTTPITGGLHEPAPLSRAARTAYATRVEPSGAAMRLQQPAGRDSLKNGAIAGAITGGVAFALLGSAGCAFGDVYGGESDCTGTVIVATAIGAGVGALIGVGVDALFERAPQTAGRPGGTRKGVQLRVRF